MRSETGFRAPIESYKEGKRTYYRYSDRNYSLAMQQINPIEADLLKTTLDMLGRFKGLPQFDFVQELGLKLKKNFQLEDLDECIFFDQNEYLKNLHLLGDLLKFIQQKHVLQVVYKSFNQNKEEAFLIHPYFLKQYNKRWFLFGQRDSFDSWTNLALDRMTTFEAAGGIIFIPPRETHDVYFEDIVGVSKPIGTVCQFIKIKIVKSLWPYIDSKPFHPSQTVVERTDTYKTIQLEVVPNYEFYAQVLGLGSAVEILGPMEVRAVIRQKLEENVKRYME
ncbi:helix-turn-helix transcriptional regulator [Sphingobacterium endophyticum]|uniref:helix-turn-helix transcriptional regulator n=1 Tax=Sphingobacterium endophyticum TaxID=2546448 RepID=UPI0018CFDCD3|nr:WYL domain-containing protein [Sphingobacterium endophyticum]